MDLADGSGQEWGRRVASGKHIGEDKRFFDFCSGICLHFRNRWVPTKTGVHYVGTLVSVRPMRSDFGL